MLTHILLDTTTHLSILVSCCPDHRPPLLRLMLRYACLIRCSWKLGLQDAAAPDA